MIAPRRLVLSALAVVVLALPTLAGSAGGPPATTPPDPFQLGLTPPGNANGLDKRCVAQGGGSGVARGDFNGDGFGDLAVGVPYEDLPSGQDAGAVNVLYGSTTGLTQTGSQMLHEDSTGVAGVGEPGDHFGMALAAGDFDGDGRSDLAVGVPDQNGSDYPDTGTVQIFRGTASGLGYWQTKTPAFASWNGPRFGAALAWGDFNGDDFGDLAVGAPLESTVHFVNDEHGSVNVYFGATSGLPATASWLAQGASGLGDTREMYDRVGSVLAAGDHDGDGFDDLAIGVPNEDVGFLGTDEGMAHVAFGAEYGFRSTSRTITQSSFGASLGSNAQFGRTLAMGNTTNATPGAELYIGVPYHDGGFRDSGIVYELRSTGPTSSVQSLFAQGSPCSTCPPNSGDTKEDGDRFGWSLALGDFDGNGFKDLAIGAPAEDIGSAQDAGVVHIIPTFSTGGLNRAGALVWGQGSSIIPDSLETGDTFGASLSAWNFGRSTHADLAIGVPYEDFTVNGVTRTNAGLIDVLYGSASGLGGPVQAWSQATSGIAGSFESNDLFGYALY